MEFDKLIISANWKLFTFFAVLIAVWFCIRPIEMNGGEWIRIDVTQNKLKHTWRL